ncbi:MAG: helix-turn-helix domain-containing protein [Eggerthellaceae bacterium]|nr:helix-turn-helix domain-containing protein [Eggerthellaceae bacterium]
MNEEVVQAVAEGQPRLITLAEAAEILCVSYQTAARLARDGELKAFKVRRAWRTSTAICEEYIRERFRIQELECQRKKTEA